MDRTCLPEHFHQSTVITLPQTTIVLFVPFFSHVFLCVCPVFLFRPVTFKQNFNQGRISQNQLEDLKEGGSVKVQCFPLYSILSALNRTTVDYFSLDIEGDELAVLKTIPWNHVHIQVHGLSL
jgi:hypothetical protein